MKKFVIISIVLVVLFFLFDLYALRSFISPTIVTTLNDDNYASEEKDSDNCKLNVVIDKESYVVTFKNNSINPYLVWTYRYDKPFFHINDSVFINHYRLKITTPFYQNKFEYGLDCGTGAGHFSINPFEQFTSKISTEKLLDQYYWGAFHQYNEKNDTIMDLLYNKPLLYVNGRNNTFEVFKREDITLKDSINTKLYLPIFSYDYKQIIYVKSNSFKLPYKNIISLLIEENSDVFKQIKN